MTEDTAQFSVESEPGIGTLVSIRFPLNKAIRAEWHVKSYYRRWWAVYCARFAGVDWLERRRLWSGCRFVRRTGGFGVHKKVTRWPCHHRRYDAKNDRTWITGNCSPGESFQRRFRDSERIQWVFLCSKSAALRVYRLSSQTGGKARSVIHSQQIQ